MLMLFKEGPCYPLSTVALYDLLDETTAGSGGLKKMAKDTL